MEVLCLSSLSSRCLEWHRSPGTSMYALNTYLLNEFVMTEKSNIYEQMQNLFLPRLIDFFLPFISKSMNIL